ncbi:ketopantoate reductase family protein [Paenibacillus jilunlii]|uniref:2-dehydropantoate 2-reductase n=1 Tax=Paenibacillus jilunlii TaxID=682956 RepID=A0A1G9RJP1_9BACL|nr:2-dehydropantoate 2-reductase N-terminal domain-containing protein [Paenibacillus jilunlii]KWX79623.1 2-dehydropantoate 2-reductase [Paenibacillus jilunlii]SDM23512.1 2-dehydropantoate 2-reductase [Paenibacillus jilunlii]
MRILVYGAGVLGSYLAHVLVRGGNNVTMLARGGRLDELQKNGNVIRHYFQFRTTADKVNVISELQPEDIYDLIFVVMKYPDFQAVLPALAANHSSRVVLVGNNVNPTEMKDYLQANSPVEKQVAFGFQVSAGWREPGRMFCVRGPQVQMTIGGLGEDLPWRTVIDQAFVNTKYKLVYQQNMDEWLKSHFMMILPLNFIAPAYNGDLRKAAKDNKLLHQVIAAVDEGHQVLEKLGYTVTPASQLKLARKQRKIFYIMLKIMLSTPVGKILLGDKAVSADEMFALYQAFIDLKSRAGIPTPNWDKLGIHSPLLQS